MAQRVRAFRRFVPPATLERMTFPSLRGRRRGALALGLALPTLGACVAATTHPHATNFHLGDGDVYEKNPEVTLLREYWIIVRTKAGTRYMLPRPDGDRRITEECASNGALAPLFAGAKLCESATQETLARVNALTADEARATSTFLHRKLRFTAQRGPGELSGAHVEPFPLTDDLLAVCRKFPDDRAGALRAICDEEFRYEHATERPAIARVFTMEECSALAPRLNELYGIE